MLTAIPPISPVPIHKEKPNPVKDGERKKKTCEKGEKSLAPLTRSGGAKEFSLTQWFFLPRFTENLGSRLRAGFAIYRKSPKKVNITC